MSVLLIHHTFSIRYYTEQLPLLYFLDLFYYSRTKLQRQHKKKRDLRSRSQFSSCVFLCQNEVSVPVFVAHLISVSLWVSEPGLVITTVHLLLGKCSPTLGRQPGWEDWQLGQLGHYWQLQLFPSTDLIWAITVTRDPGTAHSTHFHSEKHDESCRAWLYLSMK